MIKKLRIITQELINKNMDKEKYQIIDKILKDDLCFFKMDIDTSISILLDLGFNESDAKELYKELIDGKNIPVSKEDKSN